MEQITAYLSETFEGAIDFEGQKLSEKIAQYGLVAVTIMAFLVGYFMSSVKWSMIAYAAGYLIILLITVPPYPFYNQHPSKWLPIRNEKQE